MAPRSRRPDPGRRALLRALAASPFALSGAGVFSSALRLQAQEAGLIAPNVCLVTPEVTEGPYYTDPGLVRADITEGKPGVAMDMTIQVVTADCQPVAKARVDIWHCDAVGNYSGFASQGSDATNDTSAETFLRGTQFTDARGQLTFNTIYPGWYRGRTTHIHYKVFLHEKTVLTSQIFFPDALSEYLFQNVPPYNDRAGLRDTLNANDGIAKQAGDGAYAAIREQSDRYVAALVVGIDPGAQSSASQAGPDGRPGLPPAGGGLDAGPPPGGMGGAMGGARSDDPASLVPGRSE